MKWLSLIVILFVSIPALAQAPVITQSAPVVNQGKTLQFTETLGEPGAWSCGGCAGNITSGGLYAAPATVTPQASYGGFQVFPNNHVYNTRIDSLAVDANSATWIAGAGTNKFTISEFSFPINYCNGSTPLQSQIFHFTPGNNGVFQIPAYPNVRNEGGWIARVQIGQDHHLFCIDTTNGTFEETYDYSYPLTTTAASVDGSNVATLTFAEDPKMAGYYVGRNVAVAGFTGAYTYFNSPLAGSVTLTAVTSTSVSYAVTHAPASASTNGKMSIQVDCPSAGFNTCSAESGIRYLNSAYGLPNAQGGGTDAAGLYIMPLIYRIQEMERIIATSGTINHAIRMTLRNNFICHSSIANACGNNAAGTRHIWPATSEAFIGNGVVPYGARFRLKSSFAIGGYSAIAQILLTQLKQYGLILSDGGTDWSAQPELGAWPASIIAAFAEVSGVISPSNFEAVDESGLMLTDTSGDTTANRETVTFTRTSDSATASVDVALMGVAVGFPNDQMNIQANTPAQQLTVFTNGGATNTVTCSMSPSVGTLTSGCLYTPPASIGSVTQTTVTATSVDNASIAATMTVNVFPTGSIFFRPAASATYTDSNGKAWAPKIQGSGGTSNDLSAGGWPAIADIAEYYFQLAPYTDVFFNFSVPNGSYRITTKFGTSSVVGRTVNDIEAQGVVFYWDQDINTQAGGMYKPVDFVVNTTVTTGTLSVVIRASSVPGSVPIVNAIQIDYLGQSPGTALTPGMKVPSGTSMK